jgi:hypothetical protein
LKKPQKLPISSLKARDEIGFACFRTRGSVLLGIYRSALKCTSKTDNLPISHGVEREIERGREIER